MKLRLSLFATHGPMLVQRTLHETEAFTICYTWAYVSSQNTS